MKNKECNYVQDLLPNYIENLTTPDTNTLLEEHLKSCKDCAEILSTMQKTLPEDRVKTDIKEINYLKKFNKKLNIIKFIVVTAFLICVFIVMRRATILTILGNKSDIEAKNYYVKYSNYFEDQLIIFENHYLNNTYIARATTYAYKDPTSTSTIRITYYKSDEEHLALFDTGENKFQLVNDELFGFFFYPTVYGNPNFFDNITTALTYRLQTAVIHGKECYVFSNSNYDIYVEKETGLKIKELNKINNQITDFYCEFDVVTEKDIEKPDTTGFMIRN